MHKGYNISPKNLQTTSRTAQQAGEIQRDPLQGQSFGQGGVREEEVPSRRSFVTLEVASSKGHFWGSEQQAQTDP